MDERSKQEGLPQERPAGGKEDWVAPRPAPSARVMILVSLGVLAGFILLAWLRGDVLAHMGHPPALRYAGMGFTACVMIAGVVAGFVFLVTRGSGKAARWTYCVVLVLGLVGQINRVERYAADLHSKVTYDDAVAKSGAAFERVAAGDVAGSKAMEKIADTWEGVAKSGRGEEAAASRALAKLLRERTALVGEYERAAAGWAALSDTRMNDEHDLAARTKSLDQLQQVTRSMAEASAAGSKRFDELLAEAGIPLSARTDYVAPFLASAPFKAEAWRQRSRFIDTQRQLLRILGEHPGKWEAGTEDGAVLFHDAGAHELFQVAEVSAAEAVEAVAEAERRLQEHARAAFAKTRK